MPEVHQVICQCGRKSGKYTTERKSLESLLKGAGWVKRGKKSYLCAVCAAEKPVSRKANKG